MTVAWTKERNGWAGRDPAKPKYHLQVWVGGHISSWSVSTDERRIAHGDAADGETAKLAAQAALAKAP